MSVIPLLVHFSRQKSNKVFLIFDVFYLKNLCIELKKIRMLKALEILSMVSTLIVDYSKPLNDSLNSQEEGSSYKN